SAPVVPVDAPSAIGVLSLATAAIPPTIPTTLSSGPSSTSTTIGSITTSRTFEIADKLSSSSFLPDKFLRQKRNLANFTDNISATGSNDPKTRRSIFQPRKGSLIHRDNSHNQHYDSP
ncbi:unnamed protein product, partial [Rotaria sp. Silwood2]